jgi:hypothetical protein
MDSGASEGFAIPVPLVTPVVLRISLDAIVSQYDFIYISNQCLTPLGCVIKVRENWMDDQEWKIQKYSQHWMKTNDDDKQNINITAEN